MHELTCGHHTAAELNHIIQNGKSMIETHLVGDAHSVFSGVTAQVVQVPIEKSLLYTVKVLRDHLEAGRLTCIHRCDTRDMLSDALTKGECSRKEIVEAFGKGVWNMKIKEQLHSWSAVRNCYDFK